MKPALGLLAVVLWTGCALAQAVVLQVDETRSWVNVQLCMSGDCDDDTSAADGFIEISLDSYGAPAEIALHDFHIDLLEQIDLRLSVFLGHLDAVGQNIVVYYAAPGTPMPPVPLTAGAFTFQNVPTNAQGVISYQASGPFCLIVMILGYPCDDTVNLADKGTQNSKEMGGTLSLAGDQITLVFEPNMTMLLDGSNPDNGVVTLTGHVVALGTAPALPCPVRPGPVGRLLTHRAGDTVELSWDGEPNSIQGYRVYSVGAKAQIPPNGTNLNAVLECSTAAVTDLACSDTDPPATASAVLYYQIVGICGDGSEGMN